MKLKNKINKTYNDDNLLPLVNIIFLLLIFFMLAGVIAKQKEMYDIDLASAVIDEYVEKDKHILFIKSNGEVIFNDEAITIKTLDEKLKLIDGKTITIAADKLVTTGKLNKILFELNKNNISDVTLLSNKNE
tara:strand:- start:167 stop:562 length:396 start_codon:yes stop_codon:yes gene_type:complete